MSKRNLRSRIFTEEEQARQQERFDNIIQSIVKLVETYAKLFSIQLKTGLAGTLSVLAIFVIMLTFLTLAFSFFALAFALFVNYIFSWPSFAGFALVGIFCIGLFVLAIYKSDLLRSQFLIWIDQAIDHAQEENEI
ncbi:MULTISPECIES: phage holin family protein [Flammeovirga]|uniref:Phage holin family protein n=2 Tax=Flammeovirga TaxID=59739 RepID=A0A3Q9FRL3_9BACT|nr:MULTISPECIES: phage holin family protein [Flammeovirga]AZQ63131.1 hypothetical protein EI427_13045 [Flammeovirga pectinis]MBB6460075.1 putative membrane protein YqjE [Flammeovirga kamogawensis]QWG06881.1 phage holin family protein [Flammeovirga kamogawensis]TRX68703.1 hypothetical protein EO216_11455 [Flammeovirga kamogawensis]